jgi:hypothetical protein
VRDHRFERLKKPVAELPEQKSLDVWIETFDPGPLSTHTELAEGLSMALRKAEMRLARDLAPDAFSRDLQTDQAGGFVVGGLQAASDPMSRRIRAAPQRDFLLIGALNGHVDDYCLETPAPYAE